MNVFYHFNSIKTIVKMCFFNVQFYDALSPPPIIKNIAGVRVIIILVYVTCQKIYNIRYIIIHFIAVFNYRNQYSFILFDRTRKGCKFIFCIHIMNANKRLRNSFKHSRVITRVQ